MKKFWLVTIVTGIICLLAGLFLSAVLTFGFSEDLKRHADEFSINEDNFFEFFKIEEYVSNTREGNRYWAYDTNESYYYAVPAGETVTGIDFKIAVGKVKIITGDSMEVEVTDMFENAISSYVENGTWYITDSLLGSGNVHSEYSPEIFITIPNNLNPEFLDFYLAAGLMDADNLAAKDMKLEVDAGSMEVFDLLAENSLSIKNGVGEVKIYDADVKNLTIEEGIGAISVTGKITGHNVVNGGIGEVKLTLTDRKEIDFNYSVSCGIGDARIGGMKFHGDSEITKFDRSKADYFELNCGIGQVAIVLAGN